MTYDAELFNRATRLCTTAEPHGVIDPHHPPCTGCLLVAARQLHCSAAASSAPDDGSAAVVGAEHGAAGRVSAPPSDQAGGSTRTHNRPGTVNPRAAEGAAVPARTGR